MNRKQIKNFWFKKTFCSLKFFCWYKLKVMPNGLNFLIYCIFKKQKWTLVRTKIEILAAMILWIALTDMFLQFVYKHEHNLLDGYHQIYALVNCTLRKLIISWARERVQSANALNENVKKRKCFCAKHFAVIV